MRQQTGGAGRGLRAEQIRHAHALMASGVPVSDVAARFDRSVHTLEQLRSEIKRHGLEFVCQERERRLRMAWDAPAEVQHDEHWYAKNDARFRAAMEANPTERPRDIVFKPTPARIFVNQGGLG
jgi:transposase